MDFVERPWGGFRTVYSDKYTTVKTLTVNPLQALSLQFHNLREEYWTLLSGRPEIRLDSDFLMMMPDVRYHVPRRCLHRIINPSNVVVAEVLEVSVGQFSEDDIVRVQDLYGR